jgi:hypothetical protein
MGGAVGRAERLLSGEAFVLLAPAIMLKITIDASVAWQAGA